jgi:hypothetical protein
MFATAIAYLESKTPTWLKIIIAIAVIGWMAPIETRDWFYTKIDTRAIAVMAPFKRDVKEEIDDINTRIDVLNDKADETNSFVKAMALEQLGAKRYQQIELTAVDKTK